MAGIILGIILGVYTTVDALRFWMLQYRVRHWPIRRLLAHPPLSWPPHAGYDRDAVRRLAALGPNDPDPCDDLPMRYVGGVDRCWVEALADRLRTPRRRRSVRRRHG